MAWRWIDAADERAWGEALDRVGGADVYYERAYVKTLEDRGEGSPFLLHVAQDGVDIVTAYLCRELPLGADDGCDLMTPYGYGGPVVSEGTHRRRISFEPGDAMREFGAVSEFVRFHPVLETWKNAPGRMDVAAISETVLWDLSPSDLRVGMSETCRKNLGWAEKKGVTTDFAATDGAGEFAGLYRETMQRRAAADYYLFADAYFDQLANGFRGRSWFAFARVDGRIAAAALILKDLAGETIHYHLGASDHALRSFCATHKLLFDIATRARDIGVRRFHLGGGTAPGDSLFAFKAGFTPGRRPFHVGKRVHRADAYDALVKMRRERGPIRPNYFPEYRAPDEGGSTS
ncbi:MAG: GNAT family N-acetyltransferase [Deltaproteobacteria bacterium]|nr:GNAT family N-acetyltransferase [Deltaproteobacteria bacterium]